MDKKKKAKFEKIFSQFNKGQGYTFKDTGEYLEFDQYCKNKKIEELNEKTKDLSPLEQMEHEMLVAGHNFTYPVFIKWQKHLSDSDYYTKLGDILSENFMKDLGKYISFLLFENRPDTYRHLIMTDEEQKFLEHLPDEIIIYRGGIDPNGWHWTVNHKSAEYFANLYKGKSYIFSTVIRKVQVIAYFDTREGEQEIFICPENLDKNNIKISKELDITESFQNSFQLYEYQIMLNSLLNNPYHKELTAKIQSKAIKV